MKLLSSSRIILSIFTIVLTAAVAVSQTKCTFTSYTVEDGLSEGVVLSMHQDHEGFMWFGTFDGLNRFDGYNFKVYKSGFQENNILKNNRIDKITEDDLGFLWLLTYDGEVYRMNTKTEEFVNFNDISFGAREEYSPVQMIYCFDQGETWLTTESGNCLRVISDRISGEYTTDLFRFTAGNINNIHKDISGTVWIMTDSGLFKVAEEKVESEKVYFSTISHAGNDPYKSVYESEDELWFGTSRGRIIIMDRETGTYEIKDMGIISDIVAICTLGQREMMILSSSDGFIVYDRSTGNVKNYSKERYPVMPTNEMVSVYIDRFGEAWIETTSDGVVHFDPFGGSLQHFRMEVDRTNPNVLLPSFMIFEDKNDFLWIYPRGGGFSYYNRNEQKLEYFYNEPGSSERRFPNLIHSALSDSQGNLWICTISRGIEKITFFPNQFKVLQPKPVTVTHSENEVRAVFEDKSRNLWVATRDGYVYLYDSTMKEKGHLHENGSFISGRSFNALVYTIIQDRKGNIWMGSKGRGLFRLEQTGNPEERKYNIYNYTHNPDDIYSLSHDNVYSLFEDTYGRIWVGTFNGGINYFSFTGPGISFINSNNLLKTYPLISHRRVRYITSDFNGNIWVGTTNGLLLFNREFTDPEKIEFRSSFFDPADESSLANNDVHYIYCSRDNEIYVATFGGGLNKVINQGFGTGMPRFKSYTVSTGAPDDVILCIVDDMNGNLWLSSERGILKFNKQSDSFEIYGEQSGVKRKYFSEATGIRTTDDRIMFGFDDGLYYFNPGQVRKMNYIPPLAITKVTVSGKEIHGALIWPAGENSDAQADNLELNSNQKTFTIEFSALDYRNPKNIQYAYMLEGIDQDWIRERGQRIAAYNNLEPGEYTFMVRSTNSEGIWIDNQRALKVIVHPSFWQTFVAKIIIAIFILVIISVSIYVILSFYKLRHKVEVEKLMTNMKLKFFTDISHELRTPLTLISSPVDNILKNVTLEPEVKEQLSLVQNNTGRMLRLVNQILDFRKAQNKKMRLKIEEFDLGTYVNEICSNFTKIAEEKGIILEVRDSSEGERIWADKDKVEKILFNLISNALKFTPRGKRVAVTVEHEADTLALSVIDQGTGLSKEKMKNLFTRFNSDPDETASLQPGTGIGLSLSKELAELQKAELVAESKEGHGATFRVKFKLGFAHFENDTEFVVSDGHTPFGSEKEMTDQLESDSDEREDNEPVLLFVEDNEELRSFVKIILADGFHVIEAGNGKEGFEIAKKQLPDIIITDLMMPEKDGLQLAREIKAEETTSHIPVIVLTAKTDLDSQLEALKTGADDYITKPFSSTYLRAKIESILEQRKKLQEIFLANLSEISPDKKVYEISPSAPKVESYDDMLMKKLMEVMEENLDNSALTVDELVSKIGVGRSVFFKKLKSLTGLAPVEFIREVRVKRASQLIETGQYTISQVTYMVGCNDPRYFSRIFKNKFGMTPSDYREKYFKQK